MIGKLNTKDSFSILFRKAKNSASAKDDQKEKEKESKEESNQEGKEKEKEFKNIKYFNAFVYLSSGLDIYDSYGSEEFKIFSLYFEIETPPPEYVSEA